MECTYPTNKKVTPVTGKGDNSLSKTTEKVRAEFLNGSWYFVGDKNHGANVKFDQALVEATWVGPGAVEGYVKSVHGVDHGAVEFSNTRSKLNMGILVGHNFGTAKYRRVRLNEDGTIERMVQ